MIHLYSSANFPCIISHLRLLLRGRMVGSGRMKKAELANNEARRQRVAPEDAADQMDSAVNEIIRALRSGQPARLPGLGTIQPGKRWTFHPEKQRSRQPAAGKK
jgi:nucleoid DNA-binding protein